ncbi:MAG: hypothetical protein M3011_12495 [Actinomycetota bacterium]|nr:hypothetical protein [Actinomycetota bacterium]
MILLAALFSPRVVVALLYLFSDRLTIAFRSGWVGLAGFLFLPWTTALYAIAYRPSTGVSSLGWLIVAIGFAVDLGSWFGGNKQAKSRRN